MSRQQLVAVAICVLLNMLDGYDVLVMAFTAPAISEEWALTGVRLGWLLSAGLLGMAGGALFLAPLADLFGRRTLILGSVLLVGVFMVLSAGARNLEELAALRVLTGTCIGGMLATCAVLAGEVAPQRWQGTAISLNATGYQLGASIGGAIAAVLMSLYGWRAAYLLGGLMSFLILPVAYLRLPESGEYRELRPRDGSRNRWPRAQRTDPASSSSAAAALPLRGRLRLTGWPWRNTLLVWAAFFLAMIGYYFVHSWTPKLLASSGLTATQGVAGGVLLSVGGIVGTLSFAAIAASVPAHRLSAIFLVMVTGAAVAFGAVLGTTPLNMAVAVLLGAMAGGSLAGLYAATPALYAAGVRSTGMGLAIGVGRFGAILAPIATGMLLDRGWEPRLLYGFAGVSFLAAAVAIAAVRPNTATDSSPST